uniref:Uncharacterized protein n=1 Tax=uncultured marine virus TaxID=186617 RepID=A0A0F7L2A5_9VIRU|nr:hypothetical protein [uncultured marine virus]
MARTLAAASRTCCPMVDRCASGKRLNKSISTSVISLSTLSVPATFPSVRPGVSLPVLGSLVEPARCGSPAMIPWMSRAMASATSF